MPRLPKKKSPTLGLKANSEEEKIIITAFKETCLLDDLEYRKEILDLLRVVWLPKHNWPPGNPQVQITKFGVQTEITQQCEYPDCSLTAAYECVPNSPLAKPKVFYCESHFEHAEQNRLLKAHKRL